MRVKLAAHRAPEERGETVSEENPIGDLKADLENLYREEAYTDLKVAQVRCLIPIKTDGSPDESRERIYMGETTLMSPRGPLPIHCPIEGATTLQEALDKFPEAVNAAVEKLIEEAKEIQRQEASRIVVPGVAPGGGMPGPGGKISLR
jgi:hypothetical protein